VRILSHRGYWKTPAEKNTLAAFERSFRLGFGTETDLRDELGKLVVSHDPPTGKALPAKELFLCHTQLGPDLPLALNIKADGLQRLVRELLEMFAVQDYFLFDMAVPDALSYLRLGMNVFARHSDVEKVPALYAEAGGVWMDSFHGDWFTAADVRAHLDAGKRVCVVSPELHGREYLPLWRRLSGVAAPAGQFLLCTDHPEEAEGFFHG